MPISTEMRRLRNKWNTGQGWPRRLEWLEIHGIRGWSGQRVDFGFPIVALVGENGCGKTTVLQAATAIYKAPDDEPDLFASDFFPDTPFENIEGATIRFSFREGQHSQTKTVRKPSDRWRGNPERPERRTRYVDLRRIQPIGARLGYAKLLKANVEEGSHTAFDQERLDRYSYIMGRRFENAGISMTSADNRRAVPVVSDENARYSGFHQGAGLITTAELLAVDFPKYSLVLIDEIETSLHPRTQRRMIRDLARVAREQEVQFILTTHSPYVLEELPPEGRIYLLNEQSGRAVVTGVSPEFAMTRMDEEQHPEADIYVEDVRAATMVAEALVATNRDVLSRAKIIPYGSASVGMALGLMASQNRFPRPSIVYLDGDQAPSVGCITLPGDDAPECVVFSSLQEKHWPEIAQRIGRSPSETIDALTRAMTVEDHHGWLKDASDRLIIGTDILWQAMCAAWASKCASAKDRQQIAQPVETALSAG